MTLNILKKGLLVIALPIAVQVVLVGLLLYLQERRDRALRWAVHTKEVIAKIETVHRRLLEGSTAVRIAVVAPHPSVGDSVRGAFDPVLQVIDELRSLVADNATQQARIDRFAAEVRAFMQWQADQEQKVQAGKRNEAFEQFDEGVRLLAHARTTLDAVLAQENALDRLRMDRLARSAVVQRSVLLAGAGALLAANLLLAYLFLHGVIKGLAVLRDNTRRFAAGKSLHEPLPGSDEIADVDRAFHEMTGNLEEQRQENEMFVYSVSHDLRSPLINLQGFGEELSIACRELEKLLRRDDVPPEVRQHGHSLLTNDIGSAIRYIQTAVGRLARIIDALLRLSRAGRVEYQWQQVDVATVVQRIVDSLKDTITGKRAQVQVAQLPPAWGDPTAVEQIFANLIGNAAQYLDPDRPGIIEIGGTAAPSSGTIAGSIVYYVQDNGLGIPESSRQRIFTAFSRFHANVPQGEGIGLALVRRMVERHGGKIWVETEAGAGTTFFVSLPDRSWTGSEPDPPDTARDVVPQAGFPTWQPSRS
jgi:signal transduction histidine kinase